MDRQQFPSKGALAQDKVILFHPAGNQNVRAALRAFAQAGMLSRYCTTVAWRQDGMLSALLPRSLRDELERRSYAGIDWARIVRYPGRELVRLLSHRVGWDALVRQETGWASIAQVARVLDGRVAGVIAAGGTDADAVYAYEDCALQSFRAARERGLRRFLELPIGYWRAGRRLMEEERELQPEWAMTMDGLQNDAWVQERKDAEIGAADHIIVPSEFVRQTLLEYPSFTGSIDVVPYGAPPALTALPKRPRQPRLRLLYVGQLGQRKGVAYLFQAMRRLKGLATLTLIGPKPNADCPALARELAEHTWLGTMPHHRVLEAMAAHDLFIFPSLFEGSALVVLEAMSQGLPVITTPNGGGPMVIEDGKQGFLIPIRDAPAIVDRVEQLAADRDRLPAMSIAALRQAEAISWPRYEEALVRTVKNRMLTHMRRSSEAERVS